MYTGFGNSSGLAVVNWFNLRDCHSLQFVTYSQHHSAVVFDIFRVGFSWFMNSIMKPQTKICIKYKKHEGTFFIDEFKSLLNISGFFLQVLVNSVAMASMKPHPMATPTTTPLAMMIHRWGWDWKENYREIGPRFQRNK